MRKSEADPVEQVESDLITGVRGWIGGLDPSGFLLSQVSHHKIMLQTLFWVLLIQGSSPLRKMGLKKSGSNPLSLIPMEPWAVLRPAQDPVLCLHLPPVLGHGLAQDGAG